MKKFIFLVIIVLLFIPSITFSHSGRTDSAGCHTCRTNCTSWGLSTGEYHCHRAKSTAPQPKEPVTSHKVEGGVGYTEPEPEYKTPVTKTAPTSIIPILKNEVKKEDVSESKIPIAQPEPKVAGTKVENNSTNEDGENLLIGILLMVFAGGGYLIAKIRK